MTYAEFLQQTNSNKNIIFEIDQGYELDKYDQGWFKQTPKIWALKYSYVKYSITEYNYGFGSWGYFNYAGSGTGTFNSGLTRIPIQLLQSLIIDTEQYSETASIEACDELTKSFFWEYTTQTLYINFEDGKNPIEFETIIAGITKGYSFNAGWYRNDYYDGRLKSVPNISTKRDSFFFGLVSFEGGAVSLINTDGYFDDFGKNDIYGAECRIKFGGSDVAFEDYNTIYTGYITDFTLSADDIKINVKDKRENLSTSIPTKTYQLNDYPGLDKKSISKPIPLIYGECSNVPVYCINESTGTTSFTFKVADTTHHRIKSIDTVYNKNKSVAFSNIDLINGTFTLSSTVFDKGDDITVDLKGFTKSDNTTLIENPIDIIQDLIINNSDILFNSSFFNLDRWEYARAYCTQKIGIALTDADKMIDFIGTISGSILGMFLILDDGRISYEIRDATKATVRDFHVDDIIKAVELQMPSKEYINSANIRYNTNWNKETNSLFYIDTTKQFSLYSKYKSNVQKTFKTVLSNQIDATAFGANLLQIYGGIFPTYTFTTKTQMIDVVIGDNIRFFVDNDIPEDYITCEVLGRDIDLNKYEIKWIVRYISSSNDQVNISKVIRYRDKGA